MTLLFKNTLCKVPTKYTQADLVLAVLQSKGATTTDVFKELGIKSPSSVIHRLRESGYCINTKLIWTKTRTGLFRKSMLQASYSLCNGYMEAA